MKIVGWLCAGAIALGAMTTASGPAAAGDRAASNATSARAEHATGKLHRKHRRGVLSPDAARRAYYRSLEPYRSMDFKGEYPGDCALQRSIGECMVDLGYGRCEPCDTGGPF